MTQRTSDLALKHIESLQVHDTLGPFLLDDLRRMVADLRDARSRIAELEREREEAREALEKILAVRENPEPPSLKLFDIYHIAGDALATEVN